MKAACNINGKHDWYDGARVSHECSHSSSAVSVGGCTLAVNRNPESLNSDRPQLPYYRLRVEMTVKCSREAALGS